MKRVWLCWMVCLVVAVGFLPTASRAQVVFTEMAPLSFGTIVITSFGPVTQIVVSPQPIMPVYTGPVIPITLASRAHYNMTGAPVSTSFTISIYNINNALLGGNPPFTIDTFTTHPAVLATDAGGSADFFFGARLRSAGGGAPYGDGTYLGSYDFTINF